MRFTHQHGTPR